MKRVVLLILFALFIESADSKDGEIINNILTDSKKKPATSQFYKQLDADSIKDSNFNADNNYLRNPFAILPFGKLDSNRTFKNPLTPAPVIKTPPAKTPAKTPAKKPEIPKEVVKTPPKETPKTPPKKIVVIESKKEEVIESTMPMSEYAKSLAELYSLRYEVFSLKQQLGSSFKMDVPFGEIISEDSSFNKFNTLSQSYTDAQAKSGFFGGINVGFVDVYTSGCVNMRNVPNPNYTPGMSDLLREIKGCDEVITQTKPFVFGGSGGYQKFFNHYIGTRLWGGIFSTWLGNTQKYNLNTGMYENALTKDGKDIDTYYLLAHMSADLMFEFPLDSKFKYYLGAFIGINIGVMYYRPYVRRDSVFVNGKTLNRYYPADYIWNYNLQVDYSLNLGFNLTLSNKNRIEFGLFIPLAFLELPGFKEIASDTARGTESNVFINPQNAQTPQISIGTPNKPDFWRSSIFTISIKRLIF